jgi:hypothetical protein
MRARSPQLLAVIQVAVIQVVVARVAPRRSPGRFSGSEPHGSFVSSGAFAICRQAWRGASFSPEIPMMALSVL